MYVSEKEMNWRGKQEYGWIELGILKNIEFILFSLTFALHIYILYIRYVTPNYTYFKIGSIKLIFMNCHHSE